MAGLEREFVVGWGEGPSDLFTPSYESQRAMQPFEVAQVDWRRAPRPVVVPATPTSLDDFHVYPLESDIGLVRSSLATAIELARTVPYGPAMLATGRLAASLWYVVDDQQGQLRLARELFGDVPGMARLEAFLARDRRHLLFSERHFFALQGLLIDHAAGGDGSFETALSAGEVHAFRRIVLAMSAVLRDADESLISLTAMTPDAWLAYTVKHNAYFDRPDWRRAAGRWHAILKTPVPQLGDPAVASVDELIQQHFSPMDEQLAAAFALLQQAKLLDASAASSARPMLAPGIFSGTALRGNAANLTSASSFREQYGIFYAFAGGRPLALAVRPTSAALTWERVQFLMWPFALLADGTNILTISPRAALNWMTDSLYYHATAAAAVRSCKPEVKAWIATLVQEYAVDLIEDACSPTEPTQRGVVQRELSSDAHRRPHALVHLGHDLVAIEICTNRATRNRLVNSDLDALDRELKKKFYKPARDLGIRIRRILSDDASVPGIANDRVTVWPVFVMANLMPCAPLSQRLQSELAKGTRDHPNVRPLTVLALEDLELLCGLVEAGETLAELLRANSEQDPRIDVTSFLSELATERRLSPPRIVRENLDNLSSSVNALLFPKRRRRLTPW